MREKLKLELKKLIVNKKPQILRRSLRDRKKLRDRFRGIRLKILMGFMLPIILLTVFGVVSYKKSSSAIITNYENSITDTLNAVSDYMNLGMTSVENKSLELVMGNGLSNYYNRHNTEDTIDDYHNYRSLTSDLMVIGETNSFLCGVHIFGKTGKGYSTESSMVPDDLYTGYIESEKTGTVADLSGGAGIWVGDHTFLDEQLELNKENYAISFIRMFSSENGYLIMDISYETIMKQLSEINAGEDSIFGFVTSDGRELLTGDISKNVFSGLSYYQKSAEGKAANGYSYQNYNKERYLYLYSKVGDTGAMVCALIPRKTIIRQAEEIRKLSIVFVTFSCIVAVIIGSLISGGIGGAITKLIKSISLAAKGDLTSKFDTKRKDEFNVLSVNLTDMLGGMRKLIGEVAEIGAKVNNSANTLSATSQTLLEETKGISLTVDEVGKGVVQQASDTELCFGQMSNLSVRINQVCSSTNEIEQIAMQTKTIVGDGIVIIDELNDKTKETNQITRIVIDEIGALDQQSRSISNFVGMINEIASQTNLLSLNASIEAARAGEAGRGFSVVADEIRKLADQTVNAVSEIQSIVTGIRSKTQSTVKSAREAESIVESQTEALKRTVSVFENINNHVSNLTNNLDDISIGMKGIETTKDDTLDAIHNIFAVSQQTAASSEEVSAAANNQISLVKNLSDAAFDLTQDANMLEQAIHMFRIQ